MSRAQEWLFRFICSRNKASRLSRKSLLTVKVFLLLVACSTFLDHFLLCWRSECILRHKFATGSSTNSCRQWQRHRRVITHAMKIMDKTCSHNRNFLTTGIIRKMTADTRVRKWSKEPKWQDKETSADVIRRSKGDSRTWNHSKTGHWLQIEQCKNREPIADTKTFDLLHCTVAGATTLEQLRLGAERNC